MFGGGVTLYRGLFSELKGVLGKAEGRKVLLYFTKSGAILCLPGSFSLFSFTSETFFFKKNLF